jgi:integrase
LTKRRNKRLGCFAEPHHGHLRIRFRWRGRRRTKTLDLVDTPENREKAGKLAALVATFIKAGRDPFQLLEGSNKENVGRAGQTVTEYYEEWIAYQEPLVRKAQARDYRRHLKGYVLPRLGGIPLSALEPGDIRGLQAELLAKGLSVKYVKNIIAGSFRAMIQQARDDRRVIDDPFPRRLKWPKWKIPSADPFTGEERSRIIAWFKKKEYTSHNRRVPHPAYPALIHTLFWTGLRPSEAAGLQWQDVDLDGARLHVQRSRHLYEYGEPKTTSADRWVELFPETVRILDSLRPLHWTPEMPVFTTTEGEPIEPKAFASRYWYACLRALNIRVRGIYCTKDTFVTTSLQVPTLRIAWLESQTGVSYATLRRHYGKWMPGDGDSELQKFAALDPSLFSPRLAPSLAPKTDPSSELPGFTERKICEEGDLNPHGCYPTSPSN